MAQVHELLLHPTLLHSNKKSESSFLELSDFLLWKHIEPVVTHFEPPYLSSWLIPILKIPILLRYIEF